MLSLRLTIYAMQPLHLHKVRHWYTSQKIVILRPTKATTQSPGGRSGRMYSCAGNRINCSLHQTRGSWLPVVLLVEFSHPVWAVENLYFTTSSLLWQCRKQHTLKPALQQWLPLQGNLAHDVSTVLMMFSPTSKIRTGRKSYLFCECELQHFIKNSSWASYSLCINTLIL